MILDQIDVFAKLDPEVFKCQLDILDDFEIWNSYIKYKGQHYDMDVGAFIDTLPVIVRLCNDIISDRGA